MMVFISIFYNGTSFKKKKKIYLDESKISSRIRHSATIIGNCMYVFGGSSKSVDEVKNIELYELNLGIFKLQLTLH